MNKELRVGVIVKTHGIRGEVKVYPTTDSPDRFSVLKKVTLRKENRYSVHEIENVRYFKNLVILKFRGIDSINDVESYIGSELYIPHEEGVPLSEGEYYIADIIGMTVVTEEGQTIGTVKDVMETGANDVYVVEVPGRKDLLLPAIRSCILDTDIEKDVMTVRLLPGLWEL